MAMLISEEFLMFDIDAYKKAIKDARRLESMVSQLASS